MTSKVRGYAEALLKSCLKRCNVITVRDDMKLLVPAIAQNSRYFENPEVSFLKQIKILREVLGDKLDPLSVEFLCYISKNRQFKNFDKIASYFEVISLPYLEEISVVLSSPFSLDDTVIKKINQYLLNVGFITKEDEQRVKYTVEIDESLIAGFIASSRGIVLDESIKSKLHYVKQTAKQLR